LPNIIRIIIKEVRLAGHVACIEKECVQDFVGKSRRKETTNQIKIGLKWDGIVWIGLI
jgi:hypothetical protein